MDHFVNMILKWYNGTISIFMEKKQYKTTAVF